MASEFEVGKITTGAGSGGNDPTLIVGGTGNAQLKVRHIDGKQSYNADMGSLYLNQYSTGDVVMCSGGGDAKISGKLKLEDASVAGWIQSDGSVRIDIDNDDSSTDRAFVVSRDNASATLFSVNELGLAEFSGGITVSGGFTNFGSFVNQDISGGAITATSSTHKVDTEGGAGTDDLDTINGGTDGSLLILMANNSARTVVVKDGTNLRLAGDFSLDDVEDTITLIKQGSTWKEVSRSNNA